MRRTIRYTIILLTLNTECCCGTEELELTCWKASENSVNSTLPGTNTCIHFGYIYTSKLNVTRNICWHRGHLVLNGSQPHHSTCLFPKITCPHLNYVLESGSLAHNFVCLKTVTRGQNHTKTSSIIQQY